MKPTKDVEIFIRILWNAFTIFRSEKKNPAIINNKTQIWKTKSKETITFYYQKEKLHIFYQVIIYTLMIEFTGIEDGVKKILLVIKNLNFMNQNNHIVKFIKSEQLFIIINA